MLIIQGVILGATHQAAMRSDNETLTTSYAARARRRGGGMIFSIGPAQIDLTGAGFR